MSNTSAWFLACSHGAEQRAYPYGNTFETASCNGCAYEATCGQVVYNLTTPVGSLASCAGGYPGLFDMSGNVEEWEDACTLSPGAATKTPALHAAVDGPRRPRSSLVVR